jgi:hypothetical protein
VNLVGSGKAEAGVACSVSSPALAASVTLGEHRSLDDARHGQLTTDRRDAVLQAIRDLLRYQGHGVG